MNKNAPIDIKLEPVYALAEAARYLGARPSTLRGWFHGRTYAVGDQRRRSPAALPAAQAPGVPISFLDLADAHVLLTIRRGCGIPMKRFRTAMDYFRREFKGQIHRLSHRDFCHDHRDIFVRLEDRLLSLSERGQYVDEEIISEGLRQLRYGNDGYAARFFPRFEGEGVQECVMLDPAMNFGRPCLAECGIGVDAIAVRFRAGESIADLAADYGIGSEHVEEAVRWHERLAA
jgi:uncharacterized protein (DUF433 family)